MKKSIIGSLVGAILIFIWQFLSWTITDLHRPAQDYTPKQDSVMNYLNSQFSEDGQFLLPNIPKGTSMEEYNKLMKATDGKPWAVVSYHKYMDNSSNHMIRNMARGLVANIIMVWLACWLLGKMNHPSFRTILLSSLFIGLIAFINAPYTYHIWYQTRDINAYLTDALISWGITGLWLGWWIRKK
ncbi:MAG: hypothetical protein NVSMB63_06020 [Sediminibacterium sp.]